MEAAEHAGVDGGEVSCWENESVGGGGEGERRRRGAGGEGGEREGRAEVIEGEKERV